MELKEGNLHAEWVADSVGFGSMKNNEDLAEKERAIWLHSDQQHLFPVNDDSVFCADFPSLPNLPCISSSSSSSDVEKSQPTDASTQGDNMDVMESTSFGYMDLVEINDFFDPASIFINDENPLEEFTREQKKEEQQQEEQRPEETEDDEMRSVFLEWLKSNKDRICADDLRNVKFNKATIECAARHLGGGKEGMKQLLKLILEWVQRSHLHNKRHNTNPSSSISFIPQSNNPCCLDQSPWIPADLVPSFPQPMVGFVGLGEPHTEYHNHNHMIDYSWPPHSHYYNHSFGHNNATVPFTAYGGGLMRLATKEARRKRMARKRRYNLSFSHPYHRQHYQNQTCDPRIASDNCTTVVTPPHANPAGWVYWQATAGGAGQLLMDRNYVIQTQKNNCNQGRVSSDRPHVRLNSI